MHGSPGTPRSAGASPRPAVAAGGDLGGVASLGFEITRSSVAVTCCSAAATPSAAAPGGA